MQKDCPEFFDKYMDRHYIIEKLDLMDEKSIENLVQVVKEK